ncbi:hypothetical protein Gpo141_00003202 [Globisporangium polare]
MCCLFMFSGEPVQGDVRKDRENMFAIGMMDAPGADPLCCISSCLCPCCAQIYIRRKALHYDMSKYTCCQGYMDGFVPCLNAGRCGEASCPNLCLCVEAFACNGCAVSATRLMVMDRHDLRPDEWDNRIIRFNNCIQITSVICDCLSICIPLARDLANTVRCIAQCTYLSTEGCMTAQINVELNKREDFSTDLPVQDEHIERV